MSEPGTNSVARFCGTQEVFSAGSPDVNSEEMVRNESGTFTASLADCLVTVVTLAGVHEYYSWDSGYADPGGQSWYVIEPSGTLSIVSETFGGEDRRETTRAYAPSAWSSVQGWRGADPNRLSPNASAPVQPSAGQETS